MTEWSDSIRIAIDVIVACVLITALLACMTLGQSIMRMMEKEQAAADDVKDYRVAAAYEGTDVYPQDIVSLVIVNQGFPSVTVNYKNGTKQEWSRTTMHTELTSLAVGQAVKNTSKYRCTLNYNLNGLLEGYTFTEV